MLDVIVSRIIEYAGCSFTTMLLHERISEAVQSAQDRGHSISKIAKDCGISRQAIYQWKNGSTSMLDGTNLVILSDLSGYQPRWIIKGIGPKKFDDDPPLTRATPQQLTAELMRRLNPGAIVQENAEIIHKQK
jgi:transcriptional regulator with XRE-family HTH domain